MTTVVIGIDVQSARHCPYAVLAEDARVIDSGWTPPDRLADTARDLASRYKTAVFAIDAPRMPLPRAREWYWRGGRWQRSNGGEKGNGRHCEVVIAAHRLANPQWTPLHPVAPEWMRHGFALFDALEGIAQTLEVFPSASYRMMNDSNELRVSMSLAGFLPGPKDMLDATVAAMTGMEYLAERGQQVGGGDGLGTIVLPRPIPASQLNVDVMRWPQT